MKFLKTCKSKQLLDNKSLKSIYLSYFHSSLNYANITWASTNPTKLKKKKKKTLFKKTSSAYNI